ncbi:MAG: hypothetical protein QOG14_3228, partial [Mycobacterium sp.]|nr:hypothetical protein [Mycobacterium sp.]
GRQNLAPAPPNPESAPTQSLLPPAIKPTEHVLAYSNILILSMKCGTGITTRVVAPKGVVLAGSTGTRPKSDGKTALVFARTSGAPAEVHISGYANGRYVGTAVVTV